MIRSHSSVKFRLVSLAFSMLLMASFVCSETKPAEAATATLDWGLNGTTLTLNVTVTMTSYSRWEKVDYHCTGQTYQPVNLVSFRFGPGTFSTDSSEKAVFANLTSGNYTTYAIASGHSNVFPYTAWYASTGDTYFTIP